MGIIIKQGLMSSFTAYAGVGIGYVNAILLMPSFMDKAEIGLFRTVISACMILSYFGSFGTSSTVIRFHSRFLRDKLTESELYDYAVKVIGVASIIVIALLFAFQDQFFQFFEEKAPSINKYYIVIVILTIEIVVFNFLQALAKVNLDIFVANMIRDLLYKILHVLVVLLFGFGVITFDQYIYSHILIYCVLIFTMYLGSIRRFRIKLNISFKVPSFQKELLGYSSYALMAGLGTILFLQIDQIFITRYLGLAANGVYSTAVFMAVVIELPRKYIGEISSPIIAKSFSQDDFASINQHYKKASLNLLLLGGFIYLLIVVNLQNIYDIMPNGERFEPGRWVVIIVGLTKVLDMAFSLNSEILALSKHYRVNVLLVITMIILFVTLNITMIPRYELIGAAYSILITYAVYNIAKLIFLWINYRFIPFSIRTLKALLILLLPLILNHYLPYLINAIIDTIYRSLIIALVFVLCIHLTKISDEIQSIQGGIINQVRKFLRK